MHSTCIVVSVEDYPLLCPRRENAVPPEVELWTLTSLRATGWRSDTLYDVFIATTCLVSQVSL